MIKLQPVLKDYLWGGEKLKTLFGREKDGIIAESWEVSVHRDGESTISGTDKTFAEYLKENKNAVDLNGGEFPLLIKYIDAAKNLSVQVHPNDEYAQKYEHDNGKTEMWYIISADDGAGKKYKSLVMLTLGTGVGSGIVFNGKLFEGNLGAGVELGHEVIRIGGEKCTCGRKGCLEAYASATALIKQAQKAMDGDKESLLWKLTDGNKENVNGKIVFDALRAGDKTAERVAKKTRNILRRG